MRKPQAQATQIDLALHTLGWKSFQDLCAHVLEDRYQCIVEIYREAQDGGQDAVFTHRPFGDKRMLAPGTAQCKFFSAPDAKLTSSSITAELPTIKELVEKGQASTYVFMTNAKLDAPVAVKIKKALNALGVAEPYVLGREYLTHAIRASSRLRALVPRVYGLGDLSQIVDQRAADQTNALLSYMLPTLQVYVATKAHKAAVRSLRDHKIALLIGNPATGKSSIAAILSTIAIEDVNHRCFKVENPHELIERWNPNEPGGFYWIDDAFGANFLREDFVNTWMQIMPKIQAAATHGNNFVLTSRRHIFEGAKRKLGNRMHPRIHSGEAVVNVDLLDEDERAQMLYNHLKVGKQSKVFKRYIAVHAAPLVKLSFNPEACRRLADPAFTRKLAVNAESIAVFLMNPDQHLTEVIGALSLAEWASLVLIFLHQGKFAAGQPDAEIVRTHYDFFGVKMSDVLSAIGDMKGSFLRDEGEGQKRSITYIHPTISDAVSAILSQTDGMALFFVMGAKPISIMEQVICSEAPKEIRDALVISNSDEMTLLTRLRELPNDPIVNQILFGFLAERASNTFLELYCAADPSLLKRTSRYYFSSGAHSAYFRLALRLLRIGKLRPDDRIFLSEQIVDRIVALDYSFIDESDFLDIVAPNELFNLKDRVRAEGLGNYESKVDELLNESDERSDPDRYFDDLYEELESFERLFVEEGTQAELALSDARDLLKAGTTTLFQRQREHEERESWRWDEIEEVNASLRKAPRPPEASRPQGRRSLFFDVDD